MAVVETQDPSLRRSLPLWWDCCVCFSWRLPRHSLPPLGLLLSSCPLCGTCGTATLMRITPTPAGGGGTSPGEPSPSPSWLSCSIKPLPLTQWKKTSSSTTAMFRATPVHYQVTLSGVWTVVPLGSSPMTSLILFQAPSCRSRPNCLSQGAQPPLRVREPCSYEVRIPTSR